MRPRDRGAHHHADSASRGWKAACDAFDFSKGSDFIPKNAIGNPIQAIDPLGREIDYVYGNNNTPDSDPVNCTGMGLLQVKRKNGSYYDILKTLIYSGQHGQH